MRSGRILIVLGFAAWAVLPGEVFAQKMFLRAGESGFGINGGISSGEGWTSRQAAIGYSTAGFTELSLKVSKISYDRLHLAGIGPIPDIDATAIVPSMSIAILKQSAHTPLSIDVGVTYEYRSFSGRIIDRYKAKVTAHDFSFGTMIYRRFSVSPSFALIPALSMAYSKVVVRGEESHGYVEYRDDDATIVGMGVAFSYTFGHGPVLYLLPVSVTADASSSFDISVGLVLPTSRLEL
jgi:hypothetical protein